jgi:uroporphyrin-III C-methyltransferase/precorrin-2 dehydrogenase/sirohydrochlorin ferrochelatase
MTRPLYPINLALDGRVVLLVGGGRVATHKARGLVESGARLRVVAEMVSLDLQALAEWIAVRRFDPARDLDGVHLVVAAATAEANAQVTAAAHRRGLFALAVDHPEISSAQSPAVLRRGELTLAISTQGAAPALAGLMREALQALLPESAEASRWIELARAARVAWKREDVPHPVRRPLLVEALAKLYALPSSERGETPSGAARPRERA